MRADLPGLINKYRLKGILLDSNLLVLLYVGLVGPEWVGKFKGTHNQGFTEEDFSLLERIVNHSAKIIVTPHILTETSNHICQWKGDEREVALKFVADTVPSFKERRPEAKNLVQTRAFLDFGLTDSASLDLPPKKYLVLSTDLELIIALQKKGVDAINFAHLRHLSWAA